MKPLRSFRPALLAILILPVAGCVTTDNAPVPGKVAAASAAEFYGDDGVQTFSGLWQSNRGPSGTATITLKKSGNGVVANFKLGNSRYANFTKSASFDPETGTLVTTSSNSSFIYTLVSEGLAVRYTNHRSGDTGTMTLAPVDK